MSEYKLIDPIDKGDGSSITTVQLVKPRLCHIQKFMLAIGSDVLAEVLTKAAAGKLDAATGADLSRHLLKADRFNAFNHAVGHYLALDDSDAEQLALEDLIEIGRRLTVFFPAIQRALAATS
ncbi:hypothetical protein [Polycladidibacter hongkongensis]|uniref:hypothetical protein n=1 Tax=Polycladidibacter hongkongensis TaxID=1647556 RepID=UPI00082F7275|nr:hypothetical protein [Pseudovibrio hongkongensis]